MDRWNGPLTPHAGQWLIFEVKPQQDLDNLAPSGMLDVYNSSDYPMRLAKHWIDTCTKTHEKCRTNLSTWLPTRLLHLESPWQGKVRLISTDTGFVQGHYMTLSHCWGMANFLTLTKQTSGMLFNGIEITMLPQVFQDAIQTAAKLGINYLWIDSLCIFQDDLQDWHRESSLMGSVYQNGYCNIAATKSSNAHESFLAEKSPRTKSMVPPCYIQSTWNDATNSCWHLHEWSNQDQVYLSGPLLSRGWVVQERVMSPRVLHFGSNQISWECYEYFACEAFPNGQRAFAIHKTSKHHREPLSA
ncbi:HET-domain-containing protein, partial [Acephala macrosclerotiorum]